MIQISTFKTTESNSFHYALDGTFQFRGDQKFKWLQKIAIWILRKLKCYRLIKETWIKTNKITFDRGKYFEMIYSMLNEAHNLGIQDCVIVCGKY